MQLPSSVCYVYQTDLARHSYVAVLLLSSQLQRTSDIDGSTICLQGRGSTRARQAVSCAAAVANSPAANTAPGCGSSAACARIGARVSQPGKEPSCDQSLVRGDMLSKIAGHAHSDMITHASNPHGAAAFTRATRLVTESVASVADQQRLWQHRARMCAAQCAASR